MITVEASNLMPQKIQSGQERSQSISLASDATDKVLGSAYKENTFCKSALLDETSGPDVLSENVIQVECIWLLGAVRSEPQSVLIGKSLQTKVVLPLNTAETISIGLAVDALGPQDAGVISLHDNLFDKPVENFYWAVEPSPTLSSEWKEVIERFICLSDFNSKFQGQLVKSRMKMREEQALSVDAVPRTISQVRKDNKEKQKDISNISSLSGFQEPKSDGMYSEVSKRVQEISNQCVIQGELMVAVGWMCKYRGVIRRSVHISLPIPIHRAVPSRPSVVAANYVSAVVVHKQRINLSSPSTDTKGENNGSVNTVVLVSIEFRSTASVDLNIDVEAIDSFALKRSSVMNLVSGSGNSPLVSSISPVASNDDAFSSTEYAPNLPVKGIRWDGKLKYRGIVLPAFESTVVQFMAVASRPGMYDLNR